jgi:hypothetical protein
MKKLIILAFAALLFSACTETRFTVKSKKEPILPYTKVLAIYLEQACDFALFDSITYNICLRSTFLNEDGVGLELRKKMEDRIKKDLATRGTVVLRSSDIFDNDNNDYAYFRRAIDSLGIDAVLMIGLRSYSHDVHMTIASASIPGPTHLNDPFMPATPYRTLNAFFICDLFNTKSIYIPVWTAEVEEKGERYTGANGLNQKMTKKVAASLKESHYIAH